MNKWPVIEGELQDIMNKKVKWATGRNGALVFFTSEHCPYDLDWRLRLIQWGHWALKNDFAVFVINPHNVKNFKQNNLKEMKSLAATLGDNIPYISDPNQKIAKLFRNQRTPSAFVFNADKSRVYYGLIDDQPEPNGLIQKKYLENALKKLIEGDNLTTNSTDPLGCLIPKEEK
ncbi:MAG: redoxin domain-containing protein [Bdellovibrionaceae bacterium]|nr:redoxin domain-containing protein [Pseudobdellovibrionaceae bacterium]